MEERKGEREEGLPLLLSNCVTLGKSPITSRSSMFNSGITLKSLPGKVFGAISLTDPEEAQISHSFIIYLFLSSINM